MSTLFVDHPHHVVVEAGWGFKTIVQYEQRILQGAVVTDGQALAVDELLETLACDSRLDEQFWNAESVEWVVGLGATENVNNGVVDSQIG